MKQVSVLVLLATVCSSMAFHFKHFRRDDTAPHYLQSSNAFVQAIVNFENSVEYNAAFNSPHYHYVILASAIKELAEYASKLSPDDDSYEQYYFKQVAVGIEYAVEDNNGVIKKIETETANVKDIAKSVISLVGSLPICKGNNPDVCNIVVDAIVKSDPAKYQAAADLLLLAGVAANEYNALAQSLSEAAASYSEMDYLIKNENNLKNLVLDVAAVYRAVNKKK